MKDIFELTDKEREEVLKFLKPIGWKEGNELHYSEVIDGKITELNKKGMKGKTAR